MNWIATLGMAAAALFSHAEKPRDYAGTWTLDAAKSTGLPSYYAKVKSHSLLITQSSEKLDVLVTVDAGGPAPDTIALSYPLDGSVADTESAIRMQNGSVSVPTKLKGIVTADGGMHMTISRTITMGSQPFEAVTTEDWSLSEDGKTLTVHRVDDSPRGKTDATMIFVRT